MICKSTAKKQAKFDPKSQPTHSIVARILNLVSDLKNLDNFALATPFRYQKLVLVWLNQTCQVRSLFCSILPENPQVGSFNPHSTPLMTVNGDCHWVQQVGEGLNYTPRGITQNFWFWVHFSSETTVHCILFESNKESNKINNLEVLLMKDVNGLPSSQLSHPDLQIYTRWLWWSST